MKTKTIRTYNLPHTDKYYLIGLVRGTLEENATCCDNCGAIISNIASIKNQKNEFYNVGLDCAETLTSLKDSEDFQFAKMNLRTANSILKAYKTHDNFEIANYSNERGYASAQFTWTENKKTKDGFEYKKQNGSGLVFNNALFLLPKSFKDKFNIVAEWQN